MQQITRVPQLDEYLSAVYVIQIEVLGMHCGYSTVLADIRSDEFFGILSQTLVTCHPIKHEKRVYHASVDIVPLSLFSEYEILPVPHRTERL